VGGYHFFVIFTILPDSPNEQIDKLKLKYGYMDATWVKPFVHQRTTSYWGSTSAAAARRSPSLSENLSTKPEGARQAFTLLLYGDRGAGGLISMGQRELQRELQRVLQRVPLPWPQDNTSLRSNCLRRVTAITVIHLAPSGLISI